MTPSSLIGAFEWDGKPWKLSRKRKRLEEYKAKQQGKKKKTVEQKTKQQEENVSQVPFIPHTTEELECQQLGFHISVPGITVINGKPGSGKSHLLRYIFYLNRHKFRLGLAVSGTLFDENNLDFVPNENKRTQYNKDDAKELIRLQEQVPKHLRRPAYFILDDYVSDQNLWNDPTFKDICTRCRHLHIYICICTQYINLVPPVFRECAFQSCIFYLDTKRSIDAAYSSYGNGFYTEKEFRQWMDSHLSRNEFLFVDKTHNSHVSNHASSISSNEKQPQPASEDQKPQQQPQPESHRHEHCVFKAPGHVPYFQLWSPLSLMTPQQLKKYQQQKQQQKQKK